MLTNFANLTAYQKTIWSMDLWRQARNHSFIAKFLGKGPNSLVQHITDLKKDVKGTRAVITLLADLVGDGIAGDRTLEGNEEAMQTYDQVIQIDMIRNANRSEGRMANQKSIVNFREASRDLLAYWLSDRIDQLAFLTLAGVPYSFTNKGATRVGSDFPSLAFAGDVTSPSNGRRVRWNNSTKLIEPAGATSSIVAGDTPAWEMFVQLKAYAKDRYIRGIKRDGDEEYHAFLNPSAMAKLKVDATYLANQRYAQQRGATNSLFTGDAVKIDGIWLHEFRHVYNTAGAASGSKWGSGGTVDGCSVAFCGAQALGMADIGAPLWEEKEFDYANQPGISTGKMLGFLKPKFGTIYENLNVEDFGVINAYVAQ